ncbi:hypothetical protein [Allokutzneria sp. NRRL B-24872]|uniref:hypothetical protein n=1 Tax=Allokutzneria sp. NRRL B-24872 TaxID=1137961 RepID=UPI001177C194|nr:hypothetical protein [Allokutzneria sp. NRRL B-24872]
MTARSTNVLADGTVRLFHHSDPGDDRFTKRAEHDVWELTVRAAECSRIDSVQTFVRYQGCFCMVNHIVDGVAHLIFICDEAGGTTGPSTFSRLDRDFWVTDAPVAELLDWQEIHEDQHFMLWRWRGAPLPVRPPRFGRHGDRTLSTRAVWDGHLYAVKEIQDSAAVLHHLGNRSPKHRSADRYRAWPLGEHARTVPLAELTTYHEHHHLHTT